jgi:hypothetical protein
MQLRKGDKIVSFGFSNNFIGFGMTTEFSDTVNIKVVYLIHSIVRP